MVVILLLIDFNAELKALILLLKEMTKVKKSK